MRQTISLFFLFWTLICAADTNSFDRGYTQLNSITVVMNIRYDKTKSEKGRRDLPAPVECVIDFQQRTLSSPSPLLTSVTRFQILAADGETTLYDGDSPSDMIKFITTLPQGTYTMCLVAEDYYLYGCFNL